MERRAQWPLGSTRPINSIEKTKQSAVNQENQYTIYSRIQYTNNKQTYARRKHIMPQWQSATQAEPQRTERIYNMLIYKTIHNRKYDTQKIPATRRKKGNCMLDSTRWSTNHSMPRNGTTVAIYAGFGSTLHAPHSIVMPNDNGTTCST